MPLRIGLLAYPVFLFIIVMARKGVVGKFARARAFSLETARKPGSLGIERMDEVQDAVKSGRLIAAGEGRYYVDVGRYLRLRRWMIVAIVALTVITGAMAVWMLLAD